MLCQLHFWGYAINVRRIGWMQEKLSMSFVKAVIECVNHVCHHCHNYYGRFAYSICGAMPNLFVEPCQNYLWSYVKIICGAMPKFCGALPKLFVELCQDNLWSYAKICLWSYAKIVLGSLPV